MVFSIIKNESVYFEYVRKQGQDKKKANTQSSRIVTINELVDVQFDNQIKC